MCMTVPAMIESLDALEEASKNFPADKNIRANIVKKNLEIKKEQEK